MTPTDMVEARPSTLARNGDLVVFAVNGFVFASWMSRIPDVKQTLALSAGELGVLLLAVSAGAVLGLPLAGRVTRRVGAATAVRLGMASALPGVVLAALAVQAEGPMLPAVLGLFFLGLGNGIWDVAQNVEGTVVERALGKAIMPWFHAAFSCGTVVAALVGAAMTWLEVPVSLHLGVVAAAGGLAVLWGTAQFQPAVDDGAAAHPSPDPGGRARSAWLEPRTLLIGLMVLAAAFAEGTANDWLAVAFVEGHHLGNTLGVVALAVFLTSMTVGRILGTGLLDRYGRAPVLRALFAASVVGCLLVVLGDPWLAFAGAAVWGVGASLGFPVGMSAAADDPERAPLRLSVVSTIGYTAFLGGPPLLGFLGDHVGVLPSLLAVGAVSVLAILVVPVARPLHPVSSER